jgi:hypothetical protein
MHRSLYSRSTFVRSFMTVVLVWVALSASFRPAAAQSSKAQKSSPVHEAIVMLGKYKIPFNALSHLLPLFNDSGKLTSVLSKYHLTAKQINGLQAEAKALIKKGLTPGAVQDFAVKGAQDVLKKYHIAAKHLKSLLKLGNDKAALESALLRAGAKKADLAPIEQELGYFFKLALDESAYQHWLVQEALDFLEYYGLPRAALNELLAALGNPAKFDAFLKKYGLSGDKGKNFDTEAAYLYEWGLDEQALSAYLAQDMFDMLYLQGLLYQQIQDALAVYEDLQAFNALLDQYGLTPDEISAIDQTVSENEDLGLDKSDVDAVTDDQAALEDNVDEALDPDNNGSIDDSNVVEEPDDPELENPPEDNGDIPNPDDDGTSTQDGGDTSNPDENATPIPDDGGTSNQDNGSESTN